MKNVLLIAAFLTLAYVFGASAQTVTVTGGALTFTIDASIPLTACATAAPPTAGKTIPCWYGGGLAQSVNGSPYQPVTGVQITLNGITKTLPASFTIATGIPSVTISTPAITSTSTPLVPVVTQPTVTVN